MRLRTLIRVVAAVMAVIALIVAATLVGTTAYLHSLTRQLGNNLESVRAAEEIELHLLWHGRNSHLAGLTGEAEYASAAKDAQSSVGQWYQKAERYVGTSEEERTLASLVGKVTTYFSEHAHLSSGGADPLHVYLQSAARFQDAYDEAERLLEINLDQAAHAGRQAARWVSIANVIGVGAAVLLIATVGTVIVGARVKVDEPLSALRRTIDRVASEGYSVRAEGTGPVEICEIARAFNDMADTLERQRQNRLSYLAGVAHDLGNPLGAMKLAIRVLSPSGPDVLPERIASTLGVVARQVDLLARMISDLLDATRIEAGHLSVHPVNCDAREFVCRVVDLFRAASSRHELLIDVPDDPLIVNCDPARIEQVMNNLVSNAIKYSPAGGKVEVIAQSMGEEAVLSVRDYGLGIPLTEQDRIFEAFRRGDVSREAIPGVGLGLSVARRIVQAHGGTVAVRSAPGRGSTFSIRLPLSARDRSVDPTSARAL